MEFFHGIVALLAFIVLVLAGMVAWLYMQQTRLLQAVNALAIAISTPPPAAILPDPPVQETEAVETDDRVSVHDDEEEEEEAGGDEESGEDSGEIVDLSKKTVVELRELLTRKGIPFNKSDKKTTLVSLLQATA
jgi:hypothetical protein